VLKITIPKKEDTAEEKIKLLIADVADLKSKVTAVEAKVKVIEGKVK
jgi:hypothetical protein